MEETWKDIVGFEGLYQISIFGNVNSLNYKNHNTQKLLTPKVNNDGYQWVELFNNGKKKCMLIHRLVAIHFIENEHKFPIINHKDENPLNNHVDNLEWCNNSYNVKYSLHKRNHYNRTGNRVGYALNRRNHINQFTTDNVFLRCWDNCNQIKHELNKNESSVWDCCLGKRKTAYGYKWEFAN